MEQDWTHASHDASWALRVPVSVWSSQEQHRTSHLTTEEPSQNRKPSREGLASKIQAQFPRQAGSATDLEATRVISSFRQVEAVLRAEFRLADSGSSRKLSG